MRPHTLVVSTTFDRLPLRFSDPDAALSCIERAVERCDRSAPDKTAPRLLLAEMLLDKGRTAAG